MKGIFTSYMKFLEDQMAQCDQITKPAGGLSSGLSLLRSVLHSIIKNNDHICKEVEPVNLMCKASFLGVYADEHDGDHRRWRSRR